MCEILAKYARVKKCKKNEKVAIFTWSRVSDGLALRVCLRACECTRVCVRLCGRNNKKQSWQALRGFTVPTASLIDVYNLVNIFKIYHSANNGNELSLQ